MATLLSSGQRAFPARLLLLTAVLAWAGFARGEAKNTCLDCHSVLSDKLEVTQEKFSQDIHSQKGLTCAACHGGDPESDDPDKAMSVKAGFKGHISRKQVPEVCGSCHSDPNFMRRYNPTLRTDQLAEYHTSVHGKRLARGDEKVAVCTDCHSVHDLRPPSDPRSTVNAVNIPTTCSRCHSDAVRMAEYKIPTNQYAGYSKSVHYNALVVRGDLSAPNCTTCHGYHGATPPGASSVANVCSTCHVFQAQLFEASPHKAAFASAGLPGCVRCHSNHAILHPTDELIGTGDKAVCTECHIEGDKGYAVAETMKGSLSQLDLAIRRSEDKLREAERSGMEVSQAKLELVQAKDDLTKARVTIHTSNAEKLQSDTKPAMAIAAKDYDAGVAALKERDFRRMGLGFALVAIGLMVAGLVFYIKGIESPGGPER